LGNTGIAESMLGFSGKNPVNPLQKEGLFFWHIFFGGSFKHIHEEHTLWLFNKAMENRNF